MECYCIYARPSARNEPRERARADRAPPPARGRAARVSRGRQGGDGQHRARRAGVRAGPEHPPHDDAQARQHVTCEHSRHDGPLRGLAGGPARHPVARPGAHRLRRARPRRRRLRVPRQRVQREQPRAFHRTRHRASQQTRTLKCFVSIFIKCLEMRTLGSPSCDNEIAHIVRKVQRENTNITNHSKNRVGRICLVLAARSVVVCRVFLFVLAARRGVVCRVSCVILATRRGVVCRVLLFVLATRRIFRCIIAMRCAVVRRILRGILCITRRVFGRSRGRSRGRSCCIRRRSIEYPNTNTCERGVVQFTYGVPSPDEHSARRIRR